MTTAVSRAGFPATLTETAVVNGSVERARHGKAVEQALRNILGHGISHSASVQGINASRVVLAPGEEKVFPVRMSPFSRDLEVWFLWDGDDDDLELELEAGGKTTTLLRTGTGVDHWDFLEWTHLVIRDVGDGKATTLSRAADSGTNLTLTNLSATGSVYIFSVTPRELHNTVLEK